MSLHIQGNRRVLATDEWLRVRECDGVYAIGDCATINQRRVMVCNGSSLLVLLFVNSLPDFLLISIREGFYRTREE